MFSLLAALHIVAHWAGVAACVAAALAALVYLPGRLGGLIAACAGALAAGLVAYDLGYQARGALDQSAGLRAEIAQQKTDIANLQTTAMQANEREREAADARQSDNQKVSAYAEEVARKNDDLALAGAEFGRLRGLIDRHSRAATGAAAAVRTARRASVGCKVTLASYIGALNEANRRLVNDGLFYRDVREKFGQVDK